MHQHSFMRQARLASNLVRFSQFVVEVLANRGLIDVIYTDFQKAVDQIDYFVL